MSLYIVIEMLIVVVYDLFRILKIDLFQENVTVDSEKYKIIEFLKKEEEITRTWTISWK